MSTYVYRIQAFSKASQQAIIGTSCRECVVGVRDNVRESIDLHAAETYPRECCGALLMRGGDIVGSLPLRNEAPEGRVQYLVHPDDYRAAEREAARRDAELGGFYHSHPDAPAAPSRTDLRLAWPHTLYLTVSVRAGAVTDAVLWEIDAQSKGGFDHEPSDDHHPDAAAPVYSAGAQRGSDGVDRR